MRDFVRSDAWARGIHTWSSVFRAHRRHWRREFTREYSAFGMACAAPGRPLTLLPVNDSGQISSDSWVYHLPNNYAQGPDLGWCGKLDARHLVEGGLWSQPFDLIDRAVEARKWAGYFLYVNEAAQFMRAGAKRFYGNLRRWGNG
jgi:hypothetical protein